MRELFERIHPSLRDYLYLCCSFKRYSSYTLRLTGNDKGLYATKKRWRIDP